VNFEIFYHGTNVGAGSPKATNEAPFTHEFFCPQ